MDDTILYAFARRYALFHATSSQAMIDPTPQMAYGYVHVADVDALSAGDVLTLTASDAWRNRSEVVWVSSHLHRATSVGDLLYLYESEKLWVVQASGVVRVSASIESLGLEWSL